MRVGSVLVVNRQRVGQVAVHILRLLGHILGKGTGKLNLLFPAQLDGQGVFQLPIQFTVSPLV